MKRTLKKLLLWQRVAALSPNEPDILLRLADAYDAADESDKARAMRTSFGDPDGFFGLWFEPYASDATEIQTVLDSSQRCPNRYRLGKNQATLCGRLSDQLDKWNVSTDGVAELSMQFEVALSKKLPWAIVTYLAEGTVLAIEPESDPWIEAAQKTSDTLDDDFLSFYLNLTGHWSHLAGPAGGPDLGTMVVTISSVVQPPSISNFDAQRSAPRPSQSPLCSQIHSSKDSERCGRNIRRVSLRPQPRRSESRGPPHIERD